jgi:hypothetical protein
MSFEVFMDWACVKIDPAQTASINERPHRGAMYGDDEKSPKEGSRDV